MQGSRGLLLLACFCGAAVCQAETAPERGYRLLTTKSYLPPDFDQEIFDQLWQCWEEPLRSQAAAATIDQRRQMAFARYGLTPSPDRSGPVAWQYVDDGRGGWVMNCLACHGGTVAGRAIAGLPNSLYDLQTLTEDVRATKLRLKQPLGHMELGSLGMPLSGSIGTTNAVMFGKLLLHYRDPDLSLQRDRSRPAMLHHDHDAPPWWHLRRKTHMYIDGFAPKTHRALMQFLLIPKNGPEKFRAWENDYRDILAWMESLEPPKYPWAIDTPLAHEGQSAFNRVCAACHGTYGPGGSYPEKMVPLATIGTDSARLRSLGLEGRETYAHSWFAAGAPVPTIEAPAGYVAPPLDGVWATAPYLHNGSVPTLWHLLHPEARPVVWRRTADGYDRTQVGLEVTSFDALPAELRPGSESRRYFNTRLVGKSAAGHLFPDELSEAERRAVLEYLKTL
ncbi:MAG TPA: cytochrome c [Pirellulales bacterium]|nr:cytochrome c [Pirellulales bacterium]